MPPAPVSPFDAFYRTNYGWAVRVAHLLTGERTTAEDVVQESFGRLHGRFDDLGNPGAFLRTSVVNACRSWHRKQAREARRLGAMAIDPRHLDRDVRELLDAVDRLPYRQKAVLVLRYYADLSESDIAETLGCRPGTVKSLAARGLARLRKEIEP